MTSLQELVRLCARLRRRADRVTPTSSRINYARILFEKGYLHGRSMCELLRQGRRTGSLDIAGVCALARSLIEAHNVLFYLTEPGRAKAEYHFRFELMYLNQCTDLLRISSALGLAERDFRMAVQYQSRRHAAEELEGNSIFASLDERQKQRLLSGRNAYLMDRYAGPRALQKELEAAAYNLFSHNVHSFGLASSHVAAATAAGAVNTISLAVEFAIVYLAHMAKHYRAVRTRAIGTLSAADQSTLAAALSNSSLHHWISRFSARGAL